MVSKSRNKIHQTWPKPFSRALYTFLDVPVGDADDALAAVAAHEVGVAAVVEQRQRRVDGRAQRHLILLKISTVFDPL